MIRAKSGKPHLRLKLPKTLQINYLSLMKYNVVPACLCLCVGLLVRGVEEGKLLD